MKNPPSDLSLPELLLRQSRGSTQDLTTTPPRRRLEGALSSPRGRLLRSPVPPALAGWVPYCQPDRGLAAHPTLASSPPQLDFSIKVHTLESPSLGPGDQASH